MLLLHLPNLLWGNVEIRDRELFHSILVVAFLHQVNRAVSSFAYQLDDLETPYEFLRVVFEVQKFAHFFEILLNLIQSFDRKLLIDLPQQRNI